VHELLAQSRADHDRYYPMYLLGFHTGLRQGELLGLRWAQDETQPGLDLERGVIRARQQLTRYRGAAKVVDSVKSNSIRDAYLSVELVEVLRQHHVELLKDQLRAGSRWREHGLVFPTRFGTPPPVGLPAFALLEAHLLARVAHLDRGDRTAAAAAEAVLAAAEPDRLIFPFAMIGTGELLDALPRHETAHGALLADLADVLRGAPAPDAEAELLPPPEELRASELRVLRYLPTNLTRPEIARELYVSINTVNSHIRSIYSKLGARDRSSAVARARELRLLSTARAAKPRRRSALVA
jgi:DNA-binding CsgD family transcriptional regulator